MRRALRMTVLIVGLSATVSTAHAANYGIQRWIALTPPTGGFDFVTFDSAQRRVYVAHTTTVAVLDPDANAQVATLTGTALSGLHGTAISPDSKFAFVSSAGPKLAVKIDLSNGTVVGTAPTGADPDHILYDTFSDRVLTFNNQGASATVIDPATMTVQTTIAFSAGSLPEVSVSDGQGKIYANLNGSNKLVQIDTATWTATEWALPAACGPTGLAMDVAGRRLFTACSGKLAITNADTGAAVGTPIPTGVGADGAAYDPVNKMVFTTNGGAGTLTVVKQMSPDSYQFVEEAPTAAGCRTNALDPTTHVIYSVCNHGAVLSLAVIGASTSSSDGGAADAGAPTVADAAADGSAGTGDMDAAGTGGMDAAGSGVDGSTGAGGMADGGRANGGKAGGGCACELGPHAESSRGLLPIIVGLGLLAACLRRRNPIAGGPRRISREPSSKGASPSHRDDALTRCQSCA